MPRADSTLPANDDAMSSIDLFLKTISEIIIKNKPNKAPQSSDVNTEQKKSIKAKKVVKTSEVKKVSKSQKDNKEKTSKEKEK